MWRTVYERISRFFTGFFAGGASLTMLTVFLIILLNSIRRYAFGRSVEWGDELPVFIAVYGFMFGAAYAYMQDRHVRFTILVGFLPPSFTNKLYMLVDFIMIGIGGLMAWSGWQLLLKRGGIEASGMIGLAKDLQAATGWDWMILLGHFYPYLAAMILGGVMLAIAAAIKLVGRGFERAWLLDDANAGQVEG
jgi:TRAP-type C4-dicarboxylate transport system permease small subunit